MLKAAKPLAIAQAQAPRKRGRGVCPGPLCRGSEMAAGFGLAKAGSKTNTCLGSAPHPRPYAVEYLVSFCFNIDAQRLTCGRPDVGACECRHRRSPPSGLQRSHLKKPMQQLWQRWHLPARQSSSCIVELVVVCELWAQGTRPATSRKASTSLAFKITEANQGYPTAGRCEFPAKPEYVKEVRRYRVQIPWGDNGIENTCT